MYLYNCIVVCYTHLESINIIYSHLFMIHSLYTNFNLTSFSSCNFAQVDSTEGAGLDLDPETQGMRVTKAWILVEASCSNSWRCPDFETTCEVYDKPGQPGLYERDLITKIDETPLRGETKVQAEQSVSSEFLDANLERTDLFS